MCPYCTNQALHILQTASGPVEQCPMCSGLMIPWDLLTTFSSDPDFRGSLDKVQLVQTGRICPHCLGRLGQGRFPGRESIVTLCGTCKLMWTDLYDLEQLDSSIARSLQEQMENPSVVPTQRTGTVRPGEAFPFPGLLGSEPDLAPSLSLNQAEIEQQYKALEKTLREEWDKREEQLSLLHGEGLKKAQGEHQQRLESLQASIDALEKKRLDQESYLENLKSRMEAAEKRNHSASRDELEAAKQEYARHLETLMKHIDGLEKKRQNQDSDIAELRKRMELMETRRIEPAPAPVIKQEPKTEPHPVAAATSPDPLPMGEGTVRETKPQIKPEPKPEIKLEPKPEIKPAPKIEPKPEFVSVQAQPVKVPVVEKPTTPKKSLVADLLSPLKSLWTPKPKSTYVPAPKPAAVTPTSTPTPIQPVAPAPVKPEPKRTAPVKPGFLSAFKNAWSPKPSSSKPISIATTPAPHQEPIVEKKPAADVPIPVPVTKTKNDSRFLTRVIVWAPSVVPIMIYLLAGLIEDDWGRAFGWALLFGCVAVAVRTWKMYSDSRFEETTVSTLDDMPALSLKGKAVILRGELDPSSPKTLVFRDATGSLLLNKLGRLEFLPFVCGLVARGQYPSGEFQLKGWYRRKKSGAFIEVAEIHGEKALRKSMVKGTRWALSIAGIAFAVLLLFVLE